MIDGQSCGQFSRGMGKELVPHYRYFWWMCDGGWLMEITDFQCLTFKDGSDNYLFFQFFENF
jgi:hypothetical protein